MPICLNDVLFMYQWFESSKIHAAALIIGELSESPSHWSAVKSLDRWLKEQGVPGLQGEKMLDATKCSFLKSRLTTIVCFALFYFRH